MSVHTAAGWSAEHTYGTGHIGPVLNDTRPSGYQTNYGTFSATDFGLASDALIDGVRIRGCCGASAHADILAVALTPAVPEPGTWLLMGGGLGCVTWRAGRRRAGSGEAGGAVPQLS